MTSANIRSRHKPCHVNHLGYTTERAYSLLARGHLCLYDDDAGFRPLTKTLPPALLLGGVVTVGLPWFPSALVLVVVGFPMFPSRAC